MTLRGRPLSLRASERRMFGVYVLPRTQLLVRRMAETEGTTIGHFMDALVAAEAERRRVRLGIVEAGAELALRTRKAQGLPATVADPGGIATSAAIAGTALRRAAAQARREGEAS